MEADTNNRRCQHCDSVVSRSFRRVFGDASNVVHRCRECDTTARLSRGSGAGIDPGVPDPETSPGRHGGSPDSLTASSAGD
ncbi:DUF7563 family protein [Haloferax prahovense]|uniref:DUF7563 family protein n=1 Tax=Haloferax prahovense TaxID=381852 RepID=UPI0009DD77BC